MSLGLIFPILAIEENLEDIYFIELAINKIRNLTCLFNTTLVICPIRNSKQPLSMITCTRPFPRSFLRITLIDMMIQIAIQTLSASST